MYVIGLVYIFQMLPFKCLEMFMLKKIFFSLMLFQLSFFAYGAATVYHENYNDKACFPQGPADERAELCFSLKGNWSRIITSSGNTVYNLVGSQNTFIIKDGVEYDHGSLDVKRHYLFKKGELHVDKETVVFDLVSDPFGNCYVMSYDTQVQFVNGEVIRNIINFSEEPC